MTTWKNVQLSEVCDIQRGGSPRPIDNFITEAADGINWIKIGDVAAGAKYITTTKEKIRPEGALRSRAVKHGEFLLSNSMSFGRPYILRTSGCIHDGWLVLRYNHSLLTEDYLYHVLSSDFVYAQFVKYAVGAVVKNLNSEVVKKVSIPLPPVEEQRRIAAILDQADALRAKRREALAELDGLAQAIFVEMFGDPIQNPKGWPCALFDSKLSIPLRNGISPSSSGGVQAKVLTLAAITGKSFNSNAWKYGPYQSKPLASLSVNEQDFLICRGNGNKELVGKGCFPSGDTMDTVFPDTIIAAQTDPKKVNRLYLQCHWNSRAVRKQIEAGARTTNGTFKVNQALLEKISLIDPPIDLQNTFGTRIQALESLKATHRTALTELDALFASLQHRAFRGEL